MNLHRGFSLVELAMVLFIITLVLGGLLVPLATQLEARQRNDTQEQLERIKEALIGYAIINGRLPCYTTQSDPALSSYGEEDDPCDPATLQFGVDDPCEDLDADGISDVPCDGILPWKTLGLTQGHDSWGMQRSSSSDPWTGYWRYRVDSEFVKKSPVFTLSTDSSDKLTIIDNQGNLLIGTSERPVAIVYSTGASTREDGENATYESVSCGNSSGYDAGSGTACPDGWPLYQGGAAVGTRATAGGFDDIVVWITRPLLFSRMVTAGRLP